MNKKPLELTKNELISELERAVECSIEIFMGTADEMKKRSTLLTAELANSTNEKQSSYVDEYLEHANIVKSSYTEKINNIFKVAKESQTIPVYNFATIELDHASSALYECQQDILENNENKVTVDGLLSVSNMTCHCSVIFRIFSILCKNLKNKDSELAELESISHQQAITLLGYSREFMDRAEILSDLNSTDKPNNKSHLTVIK